MKLSICIIVHLLLFTIGIVFDWQVSAGETENSLSAEDHNTDNKNGHKLLLECQHSDYRTYIKCLKRQKRHHGHPDYFNRTGDMRTCFEDCGIDQCTSHRCVHDCHTHCLKRTKETTQIITQYETECVSNDCNKNENHPHPTTNITTNIDIHNNINTDRGGGGGSGGGNGNNCTCSNCTNHNNPKPPTPGPPYPPTSGPPYPPQYPYFPQVQMVSQVTFGFAPGPIGGCLYDMKWPCIQSNQQQNGFDCSLCVNPFYKLRCDTSCYNSDTANNRTCRAPHCVGGAAY